MRGLAWLLQFGASLRPSVSTETIYRQQIRPVIVNGADVMGRIFPTGVDRDA
jgi:hypothetical protein